MALMWLLCGAEAPAEDKVDAVNADCMIEVCAVVLRHRIKCYVWWYTALCLGDGGGGRDFDEVSRGRGGRKLAGARWRWTLRHEECAQDPRQRFFLNLSCV